MRKLFCIVLMALFVLCGCGHETDIPDVTDQQETVPSDVTEITETQMTTPDETEETTEEETAEATVSQETLPSKETDEHFDTPPAPFLESTVTEPPASQPPVTEPPATEPPATEATEASDDDWDLGGAEF